MLINIFFLFGLINSKQALFAWLMTIVLSAGVIFWMWYT